MSITRRLGQLRGLLDRDAWQQRWTSLRAWAYDRRHRIDTGGVVPVAAMADVDPELARHAVHYEASNIAKFERALAALDLEPGRYTFIDYGSGKGRVLLLAAAHPFRRIVGIEFSQALHDAALANVAAYTRHRSGGPPIDCIHADAASHPVPPGDLVGYFYNPFGEPVLARAVARLADAIARGRHVQVIYVNPVHRGVFERTGLLDVRYEDPALVVYASRTPAASSGGDSTHGTTAPA